MMIKTGLLLLCLASATLQRTPKDPPNVSVIENADLEFTGNLTLSNVTSHNSRVMCIFDSRMTQMEGQRKFEFADVDGTLCTHLVFRPVQVQNKKGIRNFVLGDNDAGQSNELYGNAVGLKQLNPKLKVILSLGGSRGSVKFFQKVSSNHDYRSKFVSNAVNFLKEKSLDGLNVEWMWPGVGSVGGKPTDKEAATFLFSLLSKEMKANNLELGLTLPADTSIIEAGYNLPTLGRLVDYFLIMGDLEGNPRQVARHHSPLLLMTGRAVATVGKTVKFVLEKKISRRKVILGIPFVGRKFKLRNAHVSGSGLGAPILKGTGIQGAFSMDGNKILNYNQLCYYLRKPGNEWTIYEDTEAKVRFMRDNAGNWVSFEDTKSVREKVEFGEELGLGGYGAWSIQTDDFVGDKCGGQVTFPLLRTINYVLSKKESEARESNPGITSSHTESTTLPSGMKPVSLPNKESSSLDMSTTEKLMMNVTTTRSTFAPPNSTEGNENEEEGSAEMTGIDGGNSSVITYVVVTLVGISLLLLAVLFLVWRKKRSDEKGGNEKGLSNSEIRRFKHGSNYGAKKDKRNAMQQQLLEEEDIDSSPYDKSLEVPYAEYEICADEILESGEYGVVVKGKVRNEVVAVKTVKPSSSKECVLSLLEEIRVMTHVGQHENILGFIGANTKLLRRGIVYVFVELCPLGSLDKYLKANRSAFVDLKKNDEFTSEKSKIEEDGKEISSATLLIWSHQISNAMQFLASKNIIHGDLGTRNVRVRSKHLVKISDFGSSQKMCAYSNCIQQKQGEIMPWRQMSVEVFKNLEFSTKSDVWAFGVTLWEIFSLGSLPYPGTSYTFRFTEDLMCGRRMSKPEYATTELYEKTMLLTWNANPRDRPSFDWLCTFLHELVERVAFQQEH